jgi:hypothetical protein
MCVALVYTTSHALKLEKALIAAGIACSLIPVPRQLSSDCGVCVRFHRDDAAEVQRILEVSGIDIGGIHSA